MGWPSHFPRRQLVTALWTFLLFFIFPQLPADSPTLHAPADTVETTLRTRRLAGRLFSVVVSFLISFFFLDLWFLAPAFLDLCDAPGTPTHGCGAMVRSHLHSHLEGLLQVPCEPVWLAHSAFGMIVVMAFSLISATPTNLPPWGLWELEVELSQ